MYQIWCPFRIILGLTAFKFSPHQQSQGVVNKLALSDSFQGFGKFCVTRAVSTDFWLNPHAVMKLTCPCLQVYWSTCGDIRCFSISRWLSCPQRQGARDCVQLLLQFVHALQVCQRLQPEFYFERKFPLIVNEFWLGFWRNGTDKISCMTIGIRFDVQRNEIFGCLQYVTISCQEELFLVLFQLFICQRMCAFPSEEAGGAVAWWSHGNICLMVSVWRQWQYLVCERLVWDWCRGFAPQSAEIRNSLKYQQKRLREVRDGRSLAYKWCYWSNFCSYFFHGNKKCKKILKFSSSDSESPNLIWLS